MARRVNTSRPLKDGIVIAGGGLAGQRCAETLRRGGYQGAIRLVCSEPHRPYDRPPLSKELLTEPSHDGRLAYRASDWYREHEVDLLLDVSAVRLLANERRLLLSDETSLHYEQLLISTGGRPRTLPVLSGYENVSVLRTIDDARRLREVLGTTPRLAVVGAGFIGLEVAATARKLGVEVTLIEAASCPLAGVLGRRLGAWFARLHRAEGVDVRTGVTVDGVRGNGTADALRMSDGSTLEVGHVLVGTGIAPQAEWLAGSGLETPSGVPVNAHGQTAAERVYAAGDVAATFDKDLGRHMPGSHWEAAGRQGSRSARLMLGLDPGEAPPTSFWTDQYDLRIQYVGRSQSSDSIEIDGELESRDCTVTFLRAGRAVAALLVNRPRALPAARNKIEKGTHELPD